MPNTIDCLRVWFGINWLGATYVPINTAYKGRLLEHVLAKSTNGPLFFPNREFDVLVEASASGEITGSEQLQGKSRYRCEIPRNALRIGLEAIVLLATRHRWCLLQEGRVRVGGETPVLTLCKDGCRPGSRFSGLLNSV